MKDLLGQRELAEALEKQMLEQYGMHIITGKALCSALGYKNVDALRQAIHRNQIPVPLFTIETRRGKFALVKDIAYWLASKSRTHNKGGDS